LPFQGSDEERPWKINQSELSKSRVLAIPFAGRLFFAAFPFSHQHFRQQPQSDVGAQIKAWIKRFNA
jgi:hypothetical protein